MVVMLVMAAVAFRYGEINLAFLPPPSQARVSAFMVQQLSGVHFMGDTGSLAWGSSAGRTCRSYKNRGNFFGHGGLFIIEALSVIIQVVSFKLTGKRVF